MLSPAEQDRLTRVGPGTPMGTLLRYYWYPILASVELPAGEAREVRLLGEDLAVFRDPKGRLGLLARHCPHRGVSLGYGVASDDGIACPYHGWTFDRAGACVRMPAENGNDRQLQRAAVVAYGVEELGGLIFAYLGPAPAPLLPRYDLFLWEDVLRDVGRAQLPCNWLQIMENTVDPVHVEYLHGHHLQAQLGQDSSASPYSRRHEKIGFDLFEYGIIKRRQLVGGSESDDDWRVGHPLIFPVTLRVGAHSQHRFQIRVPVDDITTMHYWYSCYLPPPGKSAPAQSVVPLYEVPWRDESGRFRVDFVDGGDIMTWVSQGAIADRSREMLVSSDRGIVLLRKLLSDELDRVQHGEDPMGVIRDPEKNRIISFAQEHNKLGGRVQFLRRAMDISHARFSPIREQVLAMLED
ncbi:MAG: Rieske 2Fe-2S domain-containing protein [Halioglobus sp.]|nr:Rieske 2Fe-2S domain-containing protein [Halioglobus sp.]MBP6724320.1 Rieske 2Fe-2S domain-containing protein [Halioglobus sp.]